MLTSLQNNLIRCGLGAVGVAVIEPLIQAVGSGYAFSILSAITYAASALVWVELKYGGGWRRERERRLKINGN